MSEHKTKAESLVYAPENGHSRVDAVEEERCVQYCEGYKQFLDEGKTERECVREAVALAERAGFRPLVRGEKLTSGDKVYRVNRGKAVFLAVIG